MNTVDFSWRNSHLKLSVYWLARMLEGGEKPLYIARRLVWFSGEDFGLTNPSGVVQAVACYQACNFIGMPECEVNLAQLRCETTGERRERERFNVFKVDHGDLVDR